MDRSTTIGYVLILALFLGFFYFQKENKEELEKQNRQQDSTLVENKVAAEDILEADSEIVVIDSALLAMQADETTVTIKNDLLSVDLTNIGGQPKKLTIANYKRYDSTELVIFEENQNQLNYALPLSNGTTINTSALSFTPSNATDSSVTYTALLPNNATIVQHYSLAPGSYIMGYRVSFERVKGIVSPNNSYAELSWKGKLQLQEKSLEDERKVSTVYYKYSSDDDVEYLSETSEDDESLQGDVKWVSFKQKFFNQTLIHSKEFEEDGIKIEVKDAKNEEYIKDLSASFYLPIESNDQVANMSFYYGPNHYQTLKKHDIGLQKMIPLGWGIFGWVNKLVVIPVFNWLEQYFSSYGIIILLLTLIIKLSLFFPMYKVYKSSAKMRLLKPELDELKEKTGGDMQKMQQAQMKLYKQAGVSPLGGCLPQLIQMPILFAMFRFFPASIELRQEKLWWADDLSSYDSILDLGFDIPFYGDHVSLFTLMMTIVTIIYTYMNSQASGQMVGPMKTVMYIMPIMFLGFFNNYAAALSFYYFLSTCITIIQNFVIRKFVIDEDKLHKQIQASKKKKVNVKKSGLQKRLEDMAKKRGIDPYNPKSQPKKRK